MTIANLRLGVHRKYEVNDDGSEGELVEENQRFYACLDHNITMHSWEIASAHLAQFHATDAPEENGDDPTTLEAVAVEEVETGDQAG